jgi:O-antigen/teichoic acid export membrane protein
MDSGLKEQVLRAIGKNKELLSQSVVALFVRALGALSTFILSIFVARLLGPAESGYFFYTLSIITFFVTFCCFGLENTVLRFTGAAFSQLFYAEIKQVLFKAMLLNGLVALIFITILSVSAEWLSEDIFLKPGLAEVLQNMSLGVLAFCLCQLIAMSLQGMRRIVASVLILNIGASFFTVAFISFFSPGSASDVAFLYSVSAWLTFFMGCGYWFYSIRNIKKSEGDSILFGSIISSCLPLWIVALMTQIVQFSGQFISGVYIEPSEIAHLSVAQRTAFLTSFILVAVNLVVAPRFASLYRENDMSSLRSLSLQSVIIMGIIASPILCFILAFPEFILTLFGEGFSDGAAYLQILALGQFVNVITGSVGYLLSMTGHERDLRNSMLFCGPLAIVLALILVPIYGALGSAVATALALSVQNLVAVWLVNKRLGFNTLAVWSKP